MAGLCKCSHCSATGPPSHPAPSTPRGEGVGRDPEGTWAGCLVVSFGSVLPFLLKDLCHTLPLHRGFSSKHSYLWWWTHFPLPRLHTQGHFEALAAELYSACLLLCPTCAPGLCSPPPREEPPSQSPAAGSEPSHIGPALGSKMPAWHPVWPPPRPAPEHARVAVPTCGLRMDPRDT